MEEGDEFFSLQESDGKATCEKQKHDEESWHRLTPNPFNFKEELRNTKRH